MKNLVLALLTLAATTQAQATSLITQLSANIETFQFQEGSHLAGLEINSGVVNIDFTESKIDLVLYPSFRCAPNMMCAMVMPAPIVVSVPLVSAKTGGCNENIYTGVIDQRPVDGLRKEITVIDNSTNTCKYFVAIPATEVRYEIEGGRFGLDNEELHIMHADRLH